MKVYTKLHHYFYWEGLCLHASYDLKTDSIFIAVYAKSRICRGYD